MTQSKKADVRAAILEAAFRLFSERGYSETTLPQIAREAGISSANVYVYFRGKLDILFTLYGPWLEAQLDRIETALARIEDPARRIERLLLALWRDLPQASHGFANNVMQALSTTGASGDYDPALRRLFERRIAAGQALEKRAIPASVLYQPPGCGNGDHCRQGPAQHHGSKPALGEEQDRQGAAEGGLHGRYRKSQDRQPASSLR